MMANPSEFGAQLTALQTRINSHLENSLARTPYREAILQIKKDVETAKRGETPPAPLIEEAPPTSTIAAVGSLAPDFFVPDHVSGSNVRLQRWHGKPIMLVFYSPAAPNSADVLQFAQHLAETYPNGLAVIGLTVNGKREAILAQRERLRLSLPLLDGSGLLVSYGVESTPRIVVLDASGTVRAAVLGWGAETPGEVEGAVRRCVK
jgi:peroxiredoxin